MVSNSVLFGLLSALVASAAAAPANSHTDLSYARREVPGVGTVYNRMAVARSFPAARGLQARGDCQHGAWSCDGTKLSICDNGKVTVVQDCGATSQTCSAEGYTGCVAGDAAAPKAPTNGTPANGTPSNGTSSNGTSSAPAPGTSSTKPMGNATTPKIPTSSGSTPVAPAAPVSSGSTKPQDSLPKDASAPTTSGSTYTGDEEEPTEDSPEDSAEDSTEEPTEDSTPTSTPGATKSATKGNIAADDNMDEADNGQGQDGADETPDQNGGEQPQGAQTPAANGAPTPAATGAAQPGSTGSASQNAPASSGAGPKSYVHAPYNVAYSMLTDLPADPSVLGPINVVNLAFWTSTSVDSQAAAFIARPDRQQVLDAYHKAGKVVILSLFGATDDPTSKDPEAMAAEVAKLVKDNGLDGVDVDLEAGLQAGGPGGPWAIKFTNAVRQQLGDDYFITHAPQGPHFVEGQYAYQEVIKEAGNNIDFYNIQYYNQGAENYVDCDDMLVKSKAFPGSSLSELQAVGVPWEKLVLGKIMQQDDGGSGFMEPSALAQCVQQGKGLGWPGSIMFWQLHDPANSAGIYSQIQGGA